MIIPLGIASNLARGQTLVGETKSLHVLLRDPVHGEFLAFLGAVEKIKIDQFPVRKVGLIRKGAGREERFLRTHRGEEAGSRSFDPANASGMQKTQMTGGGGAQKLEIDGAPGGIRTPDP